MNGKFYKTIIRPTMLCEGECWAIKIKHIHKMSIMVTWMPRWMRGHTIFDKIRNDHILKKVQVAHMEVKGCLRWFGQQNKRRSLSWFGHVLVDLLIHWSVGVRSW